MQLVHIEQDHGDKLAALFDGHLLLSERMDRLDGRMDRQAGSLDRLVSRVDLLVAGQRALQH